MHILEILKNKWSTGKPTNYTHDIRVRTRPHESHNVWERRLALYWEMSPEWAKKYMNSDEGLNTIVVATGKDSVANNPMYYLFGTTKLASYDFYLYYKSSKWSVYSPPSDKNPYKPELIEEYGKDLEEIFKNIQVEETTSVLSKLNITKVLLDIEFPKKPRDLKEILTRYKNNGWESEGVKTDIPGTSKIFLVLHLHLNPYS